MYMYNGPWTLPQWGVTYSTPVGSLTLKLNPSGELLPVNSTPVGSNT